ncbi:MULTISPECIES: hypothetical protein [Actinoplanes]|uniref:hypothetical protein n=1 Tax=Actinoplanes TaxID=1865 RepID=UPI0005F2B825|nr:MULTISPECIES: hypothetical protein [Actinoplanes]GLY07537.1 hypothetical protein Acsp01_79160 [Actinoplanes sp. NBRC 101535]
MFGRILRDLTINDLTVAGPLVIAVLSVVRAIRADDAFTRWSWAAVAAVMVVVCVGYLIGVARNRARLRDAED